MTDLDTVLEYLSHQWLPTDVRDAMHRLTTCAEDSHGYFYVQTTLCLIQRPPVGIRAWEAESFAKV